MFFLPFDAAQRRLCVETVEDLAAEAGADVLGWADVPFNVEALPAGSSARRTAPVVRQALFRRPARAWARTAGSPAATCSAWPSTRR